jgi:hypothetical protein
MAEMQKRAQIYNDVKRLALALCDAYDVKVISFEVHANRERGHVTIKIEDVITL